MTVTGFFKGKGKRDASGDVDVGPAGAGPILAVFDHRVWDGEHLCDGVGSSEVMRDPGPTQMPTGGSGTCVRARACSPSEPVTAALQSSPREVQVISLVDHFFWSRATGADPLRSSRGGSVEHESATANDVDSAADEVERARAATHNAIAFSTPTTASDNEVRMGCQETAQVQICMLRQPPM